MITDPSPRNVLDQRLADLVDEELARRLVVANPDLYPDSREPLDLKVLDQLRVAEPPTRAGAFRRIAGRSAVVALAIVAVVEGFVLAPFVQQRMRAQTAPPTTSQKPVSHPRVHQATIHAATQPHVAPIAQVAKAKAEAVLAAAQAAQAQREAAAARAALAMESAAAAKAHAQTMHAQRLAAVTTSISHSQPVTRPAQSTHTSARAQNSQQAQMDVPEGVVAESPAAQASSSSGSGTGGSGSVGSGEGGGSTPSTPVWNERPPTGGTGGVVLTGGGGFGAVVIDAGNCSPSRAHFFGGPHSPGW